MERRGVLKGWTVTLVQASFLLTILGTFMTRSGVFNSVHSFTQSAHRPDHPGLPRDASSSARSRCSPCASTRSKPKGAIEGPVEPRGDVPRQQPPLRPLHVHGADRHRLPARGRSDAREADERRPSVLRLDGRAGRRRAALPPRHRPGAAVGTRVARADASARCCRRSSAASCVAGIGFALGARNPWTRR